MQIACWYVHRFVSALMCFIFGPRGTHRALNPSWQAWAFSLRSFVPAPRRCALGCFFIYIYTRRKNSSTSCRLLVWPNHVSSEFGASGEPVFDSAGTHHGHMQIAYSYTLSLWPCVRFVHYGRSATCEHASRLGFSFACVIAIHAYAFHFFAWAASQVSAGGSLCR